MYQVGDVVLYENMGVCKITDISMQHMRGTDQGRLYYTLKSLHQECLIRAPVGGDKVFMRPVISRDEAERLIDKIPSMKARPFHGKAVSELTDHYKVSLKTNDCKELMELTMSIYAKKKEAETQKRKFSVVDERFMKRAEELLFGELSVAIGIPKDQVQGYIAERVEALTGERTGYPGECDS